MNFDTIITRGTIHNASATTTGDIGIRGEKIVAITGPGELDHAESKNRIDAAGMDVIPGCLDVHVHLALPFCGTVSCDDFDSGSKAAAAGCVTTVIDFAIPECGGTLEQAHETWLAKAQGLSLVDYSWHMAITNRSHIAEISRLVGMGLPTFKEFMIYETEGWNSDDAMMYATLEEIKAQDSRGGAMLLVHAESPRLLDLLIERKHTPRLMSEFGARLHAMTRPNLVEAEAIERCIRWCDATKGRLYVVHMSTGEGADLIRAAQARGVPVLAETCAQYLCLDDSVFDRDDGHLFACCPQVKKKADIERLWQGLGREVSLVSTDTCSFTREQKQMWRQPGGYGDWTKIPMGLPGLDTLVPLVYTLGVKGGRLSMNQLVDLCSTTPARVMGLAGRKGQIEVGFDADVAIVDPAFTKKITPSNLQSRCDWSPYEGMTLGGFARHTLVRGTAVVHEYQIVGKPGHGQLMARERPGYL